MDTVTESYAPRQQDAPTNRKGRRKAAARKQQRSRAAARNEVAADDDAWQSRLAELIRTDTPLSGISEIARFIHKTPRRTNYLAATGQLPVYVLAGKYHLRPSTYYAHIAKLEAESLARRIA
jgi:hypothetical protein